MKIHPSFGFLSKPTRQKGMSLPGKKISFHVLDTLRAPFIMMLCQGCADEMQHHYCQNVKKPSRAYKLTWRTRFPLCRCCHEEHAKHERQSASILICPCLGPWFSPVAVRAGSTPFDFAQRSGSPSTVARFKALALHAADIKIMVGRYLWRASSPSHAAWLISLQPGSGWGSDIVVPQIPIKNAATSSNDCLCVDFFTSLLWHCGTPPCPIGRL